MSLHKFGYSSEQLRLKENQVLKDMIKIQENLAQITHSKLKEDFENELENELGNISENLSKNQEKLIEEKLDPQEIQNVLLNSKLINDIYSQFSDISDTINKLEQNMKKSYAEQRTALINEVLQILHKSCFEMLTVRNLKFLSSVGQARMILNEDEIKNILNSLDQNKITKTNNIIQLLYDNGLFDSFPKKDQAFANYLTFSETYLKKVWKNNKYLLQMVNIICLI